MEEEDEDVSDAVRLAVTYLAQTSEHQSLTRYFHAQLLTEKYYKDRQEDAHEFLLKRFDHSSVTALKMLMHGRRVMTLVCPSCEKRSKPTVDDFYQLALPIQYESVTCISV